MIKVESSVTINRPLKEVFSYLSDLTHDPAWHVDVVRAEALTNGTNGAGSKYRWVFNYMGEGEQEAAVEIKNFKSDSELEVWADAGSLRQTMTYRLAPISDGVTKLVRGLAMEHDLLPPEMEKTMTPNISNRGVMYLKRLKDVLEGKDLDQTGGGCGSDCACSG